jgi:hypothetical protein
MACPDDLEWAEAVIEQIPLELHSARTSPRQVVAGFLPCQFETFYEAMEVNGF